MSKYIIATTFTRIYFPLRKKVTLVQCNANELERVIFVEVGVNLATHYNTVNLYVPTKISVYP